MEKVSAGNLDLLKVLFERYHRYVYNYLYKMSGDAMLSEDLTQDVFYKLIKYRSSYKNGAFVSWLFSIARNNLKSYYTRNHRLHVDIENISHKTVDDGMEKNEELSQLQLALGKLNESDRELIVLNRYQEIKYEQLATIVGSTPGAVKTRVSRAMKKLKELYFESN
ncbi:MAG: RNA polymerase sigma factor [Bacteroidota bacterium]